jgi:methionyl-tRNA formyltransferase
MIMLKAVILLTGPVERHVLASILQSHDPRLIVRSIATAAELAALDPKLLGCARLVAFCTDTVVPSRVLDRLAFGAYNFHPGSPQFPGWGASHFAHHQGAGEFGSTAHVMIEEVDAGPIVGVELFRVPPGGTVSDLEALSYAGLARLFWQLAPALATRLEPLPALSVKWSGEKCTRRRYAEIGGCAPGISHAVRADLLQAVA